MQLERGPNESSSFRTRYGNRRCRVPEKMDLRPIVEQTVAGAFNVSYSALRSATRGRANVAFARQVAMYLTHISGGLSFAEVGRQFGRDRTTVAHACEVVEDRRDDPNLDRSLDFLERAVRSMARSAVPEFGVSNA